MGDRVAPVVRADIAVVARVTHFTGPTDPEVRISADHLAGLVRALAGHGRGRHVAVPVDARDDAVDPAGVVRAEVGVVACGGAGDRGRGGAIAHANLTRAERLLQLGLERTLHRAEVDAVDEGVAEALPLVVAPELVRPTDVGTVELVQTVVLGHVLGAEMDDELRGVAHLRLHTRGHLLDGLLGLVDEPFRGRDRRLEASVEVVGTRGETRRDHDEGNACLHDFSPYIFRALSPTNLRSEDLARSQDRCTQD